MPEHRVRQPTCRSDRPTRQVRPRCTVRTAAGSEPPSYTPPGSPMPTLSLPLSSRPDSATFFVPSEAARVIDDIFPRAEWLLPEPYRIFPADETQPPMLGFPVMESPVIRELDARLDRWLADEIAWHISRGAEPQREDAGVVRGVPERAHEDGRERVDVEPAQRLSRHLLARALVRPGEALRRASRAASASSTRNTGRTQGDALKYRIFAKWASETREQMTQIAARAASIARRRGAARPAVLPPPAGRRPDLHRGVHRTRPARAAVIHQWISAARLPGVPRQRSSDCAPTAADLMQKRPDLPRARCRSSASTADQGDHRRAAARRALPELPLRDTRSCRTR